MAPWRSISTLGGVTPLSFDQALNAVKSKLRSSVRPASHHKSHRSGARVVSWAVALVLQVFLAILVFLLTRFFDFQNRLHGG
jgi:hypothetical protein